MTSTPQVFDAFNLAGKHAFITGASSGLGAHFANVLSEAGAHVGLAARRLNRLQDLADEINGTAIPIAMDVTDQTAIEQGLNAYFQVVGQWPDILVNNAGIADPTGFLDAQEDQTDAVFATNQKSVFMMAQAMAKRWIDAGKPGVIINIASIAGMRAMGGAASYAASKAAVIQMTKTQALELARHQIRVNAIAPGYFSTEINQGFLNSPQGEALIKRIPMRRAGDYQDLNGVILLLASDASAFMTGSIVTIDGGHLCSSL